MQSQRLRQSHSHGFNKWDPLGPDGGGHCHEASRRSCPLAGPFCAQSHLALCFWFPICAKVPPFLTLLALSSVFCLELSWDFMQDLILLTPLALPVLGPTSPGSGPWVSHVHGPRSCALCPVKGAWRRADPGRTVFRAACNKRLHTQASALTFPAVGEGLEREESRLGAQASWRTYGLFSKHGGCPGWGWWE